ncbi:hypothetical protein F4809DRAFT_665344 [Biscogniauxia mediterranea]|nr:hypothetical protein F4809DRAFT_665344 [Biscogniauxia mediterranea]
MAEQGILPCEICEETLGVVKCSCSAEFCETCFTNKHIRRHPKHKRGSRNSEGAWSWISSPFTNLADRTFRAKWFEKDEVTKWFGLHISGSREAVLVDTARFLRLTASSASYRQDSPRRQFPSITSFVGETGSGKSTLIRSLIYLANGSGSVEAIEAPVPGFQSGSYICKSTTGEVNLYSDPRSFGTESPLFYADCEGMNGTEPVAALFQKDWSKYGNKYELKPKDGKPIDRAAAVMTIYPSFLYLFSDVICMTTRNPKAWVDSVARLLQWSQIGARNTVNQYALPALIIVLNGPNIENEAWISDDRDAATEDFFMAISSEIRENATFMEMASKHGDKTMKELLLRNFSSVYVHYIPLEGFQSLGNHDVIMQQLNRLAHRIQEDTKRVQAKRLETWTLLDAKQMNIVFDHAFRHLASGSEEAFDLNQCRQQISLPQSTEGHFAEFLGLLMHNNATENFKDTALLVGSSIARNSLRSVGSGPLHPSTVFNQELKDTCSRALDRFLRNGRSCAYLHRASGKKCINTQSGHAKGHQAASGIFLEHGDFVDGPFDRHIFLELIENSVYNTLKAVNGRTDLDREEARRYAADQHRSRLKLIPDQSFWAECVSHEQSSPSEKGKSAYSKKLPLRTSFDQSSPSERYPGVSIHKECVLCSRTAMMDGGQPYMVQYRPDLSGIRMLSLESGGVRGIIQLCLLQRLEDVIGLEMLFAELFDLIVGNGSGGLIVLGLGTHDFSIQSFISSFDQFCSNSFKEKVGSGRGVLGWLEKIFSQFTYKTKPLELVLEDIFKPSRRLFGHHGCTPRLAVTTTTTADSDCRLLANYHWGDETRYLNSNINTWQAARCTSATLPYFEHASHDGYMCRARETEGNLMQIGVDEVRTLWGSDTFFDFALSVGCGYSKYSSDHILNETMNMFPNLDPVITDRCGRLDVDLGIGNVPQYDDNMRMDEMKTLAKTNSILCQMPNAHKPSSLVRHAWISSHSTTLHRSVELETLANKVKASLYFFELKSILPQGGTSTIEGWICCRLHPRSCKAYEKLTDETSSFRINEAILKAPHPQHGRNYISFKQESVDSKPVLIDVKFRGQEGFVPISGFPTTMEKLKEYWIQK